jgi:hypothetical protein
MIKEFFYMAALIAALLFVSTIDREDASAITLPIARWWLFGKMILGQK